MSMSVGTSASLASNMDISNGSRSTPMNIERFNHIADDEESKQYMTIYSFDNLT